MVNFCPKKKCSGWYNSCEFIIRHSYIEGLKLIDTFDINQQNMHLLLFIRFSVRVKIFERKKKKKTYSLEKIREEVYFNNVPR